MGLLTWPFRLPWLPVKSVIKLTETIGDEADRQYHDTSAVRREIEEAEQGAAAGEIPAGEAEERQEAALSRLTRPQAPAAGPNDDDGGEED